MTRSMESYFFVWKNFKDRIFILFIDKKKRKKNSRYVTISIGLCYSLKRYTWINVLFFLKNTKLVERNMFAAHRLRINPWNEMCSSWKIGTILYTRIWKKSIFQLFDQEIFKLSFLVMLRFLLKSLLLI